MLKLNRLQYISPRIKNYGPGIFYSAFQIMFLWANLELSGSTLEFCGSIVHIFRLNFIKF